MKNAKILLLPALLALLAGCSAGGGVKKGGSVEERAVKRWELLIDHKGCLLYTSRCV